MSRDKGREESIADELRSASGVTEKAMFGGWARLVDGKLLCGARDDGMLVRLGKATMTDDDLIQAATRLAGEFRTSADCVAGGVATALLSRNGHLYTGICVDTACSLGACAEYSAIADMLKARESQIDTIVAVCGTEVVPPCGRCRELIRQVSDANAKTRIIVARGRVVFLSELLPVEWKANPAPPTGAEPTQETERE
jgi:cytidine deaminase